MEGLRLDVDRWTDGWKGCSWMGGGRDGWRHGLVEGWMGGGMDGWRDGWVEGWMDGGGMDGGEDGWMGVGVG